MNNKRKNHCGLDVHVEPNSATAESASDVAATAIRIILGTTNNPKPVFTKRLDA
jgi:hypothetical protein